MYPRLADGSILKLKLQKVSIPQKTQYRDIHRHRCRPYGVPMYSTAFGAAYGVPILYAVYVTSHRNIGMRCWVLTAPPIQHVSTIVGMVYCIGTYVPQRLGIIRSLYLSQHSLWLGGVYSFCPLEWIDCQNSSKVVLNWRCIVVQGGT